MVLDDSTWYLVKSTTGVTGFIPPGNKPVPLQDREVKDILEAVEGNVPVPVIKFEKNEWCASPPGRSPNSPAKSKRSMRTRRSSKC